MRLTLTAVLVAAVAAVSLFGILASGGGIAHATGPITVTAVAAGDAPPYPQASASPGPCTLLNADGLSDTAGFLINTNNAGAGFPCGDGQDEYTNWIFDFQTGGFIQVPNPHYQPYLDFKACLEQPGSQLTSAKLTLYRSNGADTSTDGVAMLGKVADPNLSDPGQNTAIQAWAAGTPSTPSVIIHNWGAASLPLIKTNFLHAGNVVPTNNVLGSYSPPNPLDQGEIAMQYQDDALITYAQLDLTCTPPEPIGGVVDVLSSTDGQAGNTLPISAAVAAIVVAIAAGSWYTRKRWLP
jgi:hypothetical protein